MARVVMYRDLLTQAVATGEVADRSEDLLLAELVDSRVRLHTAGAAVPVRSSAVFQSRAAVAIERAERGIRIFFVGPTRPSRPPGP